MDGPQYFFDQIVETAVLDETIISAARANSQEKFMLVFKNLLEQLFTERIDQNEDIFARFMEGGEFQKDITRLLSQMAYTKINFGPNILD